MAATTRRTKESRAELRFSVSRVDRDLRRAAGAGMRMSPYAAVFATAVIEGATATVIFRAHESAGESRARITPATLAHVIRDGDGALSSLLSGVDVLGAGLGGGKHAAAPTRRRAAKTANPKKRGAAAAKRRGPK